MDYDIKVAASVINQRATFEPEFIEVGSIEDCADLINKPHGDYPHYVQRTAEGIELILSAIEANSHSWHGWSGVGIDSFMVRQLHAHIFQDTTHGGLYRDQETSSKYLPFYEIPSALETILPLNPFNLSDFYQQAMDDMTDWYKAYETIHPFLDGNGRTGGVLLAAVMFHRHNRWYAPLQ